jgi:hypothetical protein
MHPLITNSKFILFSPIYFETLEIAQLSDYISKQIEQSFHPNLGKIQK